MSAEKVGLQAYLDAAKAEREVLRARNFRLLVARGLDESVAARIINAPTKIPNRGYPDR